VFRRDGVADLIDAAVYTSEIEWTKPHPSAFRAALDAVGVADPGRCVFVGDRPWDDIAGAKGVGMRAVLLPHSTIPAYQQGPVEGEPDATISRLAELLPLIDAWR
jgi:putative hydrolase of the HAD superfamily